jgi:hypothetical protein
LESAEPYVESVFKKPGGDTAEPRQWATLRDEMGEQLLNRSKRGLLAADESGCEQGGGRPGRCCCAT